LLAYCPAPCAPCALRCALSTHNRTVSHASSAWQGCAIGMSLAAFSLLHPASLHAITIMQLRRCCTPCPSHPQASATRSCGKPIAMLPRLPLIAPLPASRLPNVPSRLAHPAHAASAACATASCEARGMPPIARARWGGEVTKHSQNLRKNFSLHAACPAIGGGDADFD
jgi:hypothetical protein